MYQVISTRLPDRTAERLKQLARQLGKTPSETSAILIEEIYILAGETLSFIILTNRNVEFEDESSSLNFGRDSSPVNRHAV